MKKVYIHLDPGGLHIEGRAVQRELEDTYMAGSEEGTFRLCFLDELSFGQSM